jgi:hypothetical protein
MKIFLEREEQTKALAEKRTGPTIIKCSTEIEDAADAANRFLF